jgi:colicin import membrane protein
MNTQVTKSSGNNLFDQKAVDAVYKVKRIEEIAELDSYVFERNFRQVDLVFNPQDLRH